MYLNPRGSCRWRSYETYGMKRLLGSSIFADGNNHYRGSYNRIKTRTSDMENGKILLLPKEAVLNLETRGKIKYRRETETMNRLAVTENGSIIFAMEKGRRKTGGFWRMVYPQARIKTSSWLTFRSLCISCVVALCGLGLPESDGKMWNSGDSGLAVEEKLYRQRHGEVFNRAEE